MRRRADRDDPERWAHQRMQATGLPLFSSSAAIEAGMTALSETAAKHEDMIVRLIPLARELAAKAGESGVVIADVRLAAEQRGLLSGQERGRQLAYLGAVMARAGLRNTGTYRRSFLAKSNGNLQAVWVLP